MNANELTALIGECLRETDDHKFFLKLESVLRQQQAEIEALKVGDIKWSHAFDLAKIEIADLKTEIEALEILVDELAGYKASYENGIRMEDGYGFN